MQDSSSIKTLKFATLSAALALLSVFILGLCFSFPRIGNSTFFLAGVVFVLPVSLGPFIAGKRQWLVPSPLIRRCIAAALPTPLFPAAALIGMAGWGDIQEHMVRGFLHHIHRELPDPPFHILVLLGITLFGATALTLLVWISISALTNHWRLRMIPILWVSFAVLSSAAWAGLFVLNSEGLGLVVSGAIFISVTGFLYAYSIEMNSSSRGIHSCFRFAVFGGLTVFVVAAAVCFAKSVPEKRYPTLSSGPLWTFDIETTGCRPVWGGPTPSQAPNALAFSTNSVLGMAFETEATPLNHNQWAYKSCIFTLDVNSGRELAQISVNGGDPIISPAPQDDFQVRLSDKEILFTAMLKRPSVSQDDHGLKPETPAAWKNFRAGPDGKLWLDANGKSTLLAAFPCGQPSIRPLGAELVLVTTCHQFSLFSTSGRLISTERFVREDVNFAALSANHKRFAMAVYVWGMGDPSYLEEERIVVYDAGTGKTVVAIPSDPLPQQQSWAALSPDGSLLAVGAQSTLRLVRLPPPKTTKQP